MSATIIYGVVFGKPKEEDAMAQFYADCKRDGAPASPDKMTADHPNAFVTEDGDIFYMSPPIQLPCDSEAE